MTSQPASTETATSSQRAQPAAIDIGRIIDRATLTQFTVKLYRGKRQAPKITQAYVDWMLTTTGERIDPSLIGTEIRLASVERVREMANLRRAIRDRWEAVSVPWDNAGRRALLTGRLIGLSRDIDAFERDTWQPAVERFIADFPSMVAESRNRLGPLGDDSINLYGNVYPFDPTTGQLATNGWQIRLRAAFTFRFTLHPFPTLNDWRAEGLTDAELETFRQRVQAENLDAIREAQKDGFRQLKEAIDHLIDRLTGYTGGRKGSFQQATLDAIGEMVAKLPALNLTGDPAVDVFAELAANLAARDLQSLRDDDNYRADTIKQSAEMSDLLSDFV